jgi:FkbM family methyltransferase
VPFLTYAKNFEDVMLWRALKRIEGGFYVDIGANHPVVDSVSKAFYDRGWRGIHIEPVPEIARLFRQARPEEVVIEKAAGAEAGMMALHVIPGTGLSSLVAAAARKPVTFGGYECKEVKVPVVTLDELLAPYAGREVHWLKIDIESAERDVLRGWNAKRDRPWIMVVEATAPNSPEACHEAWENILIASGYQFAYFDGLSRFYVSNEHCDLAESFRRPPNVFDDFQRADYVIACAVRDENARQLADVRQRLEAFAAEVASLREERDAVVHSIFWRLMAPLRKLGTTARLMGRRADQVWPLVRHVFSQSKLASIAPARGQTPETDRYAAWIAQHERLGERPSPEAASGGLVVSVLMIATHSRAALVAATLRSLEDQSVPGWQLVLGSLDLDEVERATLGALHEDGDGRIVLAPDGSATLGAALREAAFVATGDFILVLEPGDTLPSHAVATIAARLCADSSIDILYADEDVLDDGVRRSPQFKPEWSPELLTAYNYFGRPTVMRRSLVSEAGSFAADLGAAAEWDLCLRATEPFACSAWTPYVRRHPEVLCHRHPASGNGHPGPKEPASADFREALVRHLQRKGIEASVTTEADGTQRAVWDIDEAPLVSVVIPSKNRATLLSVCLDGLLHRTTYPRIEVIIVDDASTEAQTLVLYEEIEKRGARVIPYNEPFNYSRACNIGASAASGELFLFLNNDVEILWEGWLAELVRYALRPSVGVVGTKLVYPTGVLQHAGVLLGLDVCGLVFTRAPEHEWGVFGSPSVTRNCMGVMGACQLVRRDVFERVGGFDEACTVATSDVRLSLDAWRAGYRTVYAPHGRLVHHEGTSRGRTNPEADINRTAAAIRALGIEADPYYHPGLSGTIHIPTLRVGADPSAADSLKRDIDRRVGPFAFPLIPDLRDDAAIAAAAERGRDEILWHPDEPGNLPDAMTAARFMVDLLRRRPDIARRFPNALSEGVEGRFATWLKSDALRRFGYPTEANQSIDAAFRADLATKARRIASVTEGHRVGDPFMFRTTKRRELVRRLFAAVARGELSKEGAWWFLLETAEVGPIRNGGAVKHA